jgi:hypothetical protein
MSALAEGEFHVERIKLTPEQIEQRREEAKRILRDARSANPDVRCPTEHGNNPNTGD